LNVRRTSSLGTGILTISGGTTLDNTSGSAKVTTKDQNPALRFRLCGSSNLTLDSAAMNANRKVMVNGRTRTVGDVIGNFSLTKAGKASAIHY
jgi:hypothetical protein